MLKLDSLPQATRALFEIISQEPLLKDFTLIGGTALALQFHHRLSEDLDFWLSGERSLNKNDISTALRSLVSKGFPVTPAWDPAKRTALKINGIDLLEHAQDYVIGGVKVTFFARNDVPYEHFNQFERLSGTNTSFKIMGSGGLLAMKSFVIHERTRSRDLYDLKTFIAQGRSLEDIFSAGSAADPSYSIEYAKSVLVGDVPLDKEDEGLAPLATQESIEDIYSFFKAEVDSYEQLITKNISSASKGPSL